MKTLHDFHHGAFPMIPSSLSTLFSVLKPECSKPCWAK
jgi:hypothetical protein